MERAKPRLVVGEPIARGGMGAVHIAFREVGSFRRVLALKRPAGVAGEDAYRQLLREAELAATVRHPNVVEVLSVGVDKRGVYLLMDYVDGLPLTELSSLPPQLALQVIRDVARGLSAAHDLAEAIVHRDVSPSNILVGFDGSVRLMDFGLANSTRDPRTSRYLRGTPGYLAPETLRFEAAAPPADVFALGVVLYEQVAGTRLYDDADIRVVAKRILEETPSLPTSPVGVLLGAMLAKDPVARPTAGEVADRVELARRALVRTEGSRSLREHLATHHRQARDARRAWIREQWARSQATPSRRRWWIAAAAAALVAGSAFLWMTTDDDPRPRPAPVEDPPALVDEVHETTEPASATAAEAIEGLSVPEEEATIEPAQAPRMRPRRSKRRGSKMRQFWGW